MNAVRTLYRAFWICAAVLALALSATVFAPKWREYRGLLRKKADMEEAVRRENDRLNELRRHQERFASDPDFVERLAHEHGLARPGEVLFKIPPDELPKEGR